MWSKGVGVNIEEIVEKSADIAGIFKHLSHQKRLMILCSLMEEKRTVGDLSEFCDMSQPQTSQFLKRMELEGLLSSEREGNYIYYKIKDKRIGLLMKQVKKIFC